MDKQLETPLKGGSGATVTRRGNVVLREAHPWTRTIHALLKHLENVGFKGAPRVVGTGFDEQGREMLTYIEGEWRHEQALSDETLIAIGQMIRDLHLATGSFHIPADAVWRPWFGRECGGDHRFIGHCDAAPWNIIT